MANENPLAAEQWFERARQRDATDADGRIADYTEAIRLNPNYAEAYARRGANRAAQGDVSGAIADLNEAIRLNPRLSEAYNNRGSIRGSSGDLDGAMADLNEAIRLNPQYANAYFNRAIIHQGRNEMDAVIADCTEAVRLNPRLAEAYAGLGDGYYVREQWGEALQAYEKCLELLPNGENRDELSEVVEELRTRVQ